MRRAARFEPVDGAPNLRLRTGEEHGSYWTVALGGETAIHGERIAADEGFTLRHWEPGASKLAAGLARGYDGPMPSPGERWLYLGAASGTTASHIGDLVGAAGSVHLVERSLRPFVRLVALAERYPNLLPSFADARHPESYAGDVPAVDGLYVDIAQADQIEIARANARRFLRANGWLLLALKTASMGRERDARGHRDAAVELLRPTFELEEPIGLEPFHRRHYLLAGRPKARLFEETATAPPARGERRAGRRS